MEINYTQEEGKDEIQIEHNFHEDDECNICSVPINAVNGTILNVVATDYDETKLYCTYCAKQILHALNKMRAEPWGIRLCDNCSIPNDECKCNKKKIDYNLRKKLK